MDLTTRCPECGALFTASLEQLKLRKGYIRCVECANIFDGFEAVVPEKDVALALTSPSSPPLPPSSSMAASRARQVPAQPSRAAVPDDPWSVDDEPLLWLDDEADAHELQRHEDRFVISGRSASDTTMAKGESPAEAPAAIVVEPRRQRGARASSPAFLSERRRGSGIAGFIRWVFVVLLLAVLAGALLYAFRTQVAAEVPQSRPLLEKVCQWLGCTVEYPQRIERIGIDLKDKHSLRNRLKQIKRWVVSPDLAKSKATKVSDIEKQLRTIDGDNSSRLDLILDDTHKKISSFSKAKRMRQNPYYQAYVSWSTSRAVMTHEVQAYERTLNEIHPGLRHREPETYYKLLLELAGVI